MFSSVVWFVLSGRGQLGREEGRGGGKEGGVRDEVEVVGEEGADDHCEDDAEGGEDEAVDDGHFVLWTMVNTDEEGTGRGAAYGFEGVVEGPPHGTARDRGDVERKEGDAPQEVHKGGVRPVADALCANPRTMMIYPTAPPSALPFSNQRRTHAPILSTQRPHAEQ